MTNLVLIGIGISSLFSAITTAIIYLSKNESQVKSAMFWMLGSFSGIKWSYIPLPLVALIAVLIFVCYSAMCLIRYYWVQMHLHN